MNTANLKGYTSGQLLRISLVLLILASSFGWSFLAVRPAQAQPLSPAATRTSPVSKKVQPTDAGQIQFGSSTYTTTEGQTGTLITVNRTGSSTGAVTATVVLTDVTTYPNDYQFSPTITPGTLDPTFNIGTLNSNIFRIIQQSDGKILINGTFTTYNSVPITGLARLNADGSLDTTFNAGGAGFNGFVFAMAQQPDNKILASGAFTTYNGVAVPNLIRLNADGSLDPTFNPGGSGPGGGGFNAYVTQIALQSNGKIVIGHYFGSSFSYNGTSVPSLIRLNTDGTLDTTFNPGGSGLNTGSQSLNALVVQPDDKILLADIASYNGVAVKHVARLNVDGTLDPSFTIPSLSTPNDIIRALTLQPDGKIVVGSYNYFAPIFRANSDGSLDATFTPNLASSLVSQTVVLKDGKLFIDGAFSSYSGTSTPPFFARINPDGTLDTSFDLSHFPNPALNVAGLQSDGKILLYRQTLTTSNLYRLNTAMGVTFSWSDGDTSPRSFLITATDDTLYEPTKTLEMGLTDLQGGATAGSPVMTTLSIIDNDTPDHINIITGANQSTTINSNFPQQLQVRVLTQQGTPAGSVPVTFTAPASGPSGTFANGSAVFSGTTDVNGYITATSTVIVNGQFRTPTLLANGLAGSYTVTATAAGIITPTTFVLTNTVGATSLSLTSSPNPSLIGTSVTFTATVSPIAASGSVTFTDGGSVLATIPIVSGTAVYTTSSLSVGNHVIQASYGGDANYAGASKTITQVVQAISTTISLVNNPNPSIVSNTVTFTATVSPLAASGTVTFTDGANGLGTASLVSGTAVYTTSSLSIGSHVITAIYSGDAIYAGSTSQSVNQLVVSALTVFSITDDGTGLKPGTLSYALSQPITGSNPFTITFALTQGNTITFTGSLTTTASLKAYGAIYGGAFGSGNRIIINGNGVIGDGLHLKGQNRLTNLTIYGFGNRQLVLESTGNIMQGVKVIA